MDHEEDCQLLRRNGFAEAEMHRLRQFRKKYLETEKRHWLKERRRLEFARWLVSTGKLSDQIA